MPNRRLVVTQNISANGVIEFLDPWFDPSNESDDQLEVVMAQSADEDALLLGRQTFEDFRAFWPLQTDDSTGISAYLDQVPKFVYSSTLTDPGWANSTVITGDLAEAVAALKASNELPWRGGEICVTGSIRLTHALLARDLVDEIRLFVYPVLSSRGRNLVPDGLSMRELRLVTSRTFGSGVTLVTYARA